MTLPQIPSSNPINASAGPLGSYSEAWIVGWSSGNGSSAPYIVTIASNNLTPGISPVPAAVEVVSEWSDGPQGTTLADFGVTSFSPPTGQALTLLQAIDAAVVAASALYGTSYDVLDDPDNSLRQTIYACWLSWVQNGGNLVPGGGGGQLQTLAAALG